MAKNKKDTFLMDLFSAFEKSDLRTDSPKEIQQKNSTNINIECSYPEMNNLSQEYKRSIELLSIRIKELTNSYKLLCTNSQDPLKDSDCIELKRRLDVLTRLRTELKEVTQEVKEYYNPKHWRSELYTMNMKKAQVFRWVPYTDDSDE